MTNNRSIIINSNTINKINWYSINSSTWIIDIVMSNAKVIPWTYLEKNVIYSNFNKEILQVFSYDTTNNNDCIFA